MCLSEVLYNKILQGRSSFFEMYELTTSVFHGLYWEADGR